MSPPAGISLLTLPMPEGPGSGRARAWLCARWLFYFVRGRVPPEWSGHEGVTNSMVRGLRQARLPFNHNPRRLGQLSRTVLVPGGIPALRQAILLKRQGLIETLVCGPNISVLATDHRSILLAPEIDGILNHCRQGRDFVCRDAPALRKKFILWAAGVDPEFWKPCRGAVRDHILIFDKHGGPGTSPGRIEVYQKHLRDLGWKVAVLRRTEHQGYTPRDYLSLLEKSALMVGFTKYHGESQGIAWAEAWSMNVPTLILQRKSTRYLGRTFRTDSAPFLTDQTGRFFQDFQGFQREFRFWLARPNRFRPRAWVLRHMSDEVCARDLFRKIQRIRSFSRVPPPDRARRHPEKPLTARLSRNS